MDSGNIGIWLLVMYLNFRTFAELHHVKQYYNHYFIFRRKTQKVISCGINYAHSRPHARNLPISIGIIATRVEWMMELECVPFVQRFAIRIMMLLMPNMDHSFVIVGPKKTIAARLVKICCCIVDCHCDVLCNLSWIILKIEKLDRICLGKPM